MIELYTARTNNGYRALIGMEEAGLPYTLHLIDLVKGEQMTDAFRRLNITHKIPVIVDPAGPEGGAITVPESSAILRYLIDKTDSFLMPVDRATRWEVEVWFSYGMTTFAAILPQYRHFLHRALLHVPEAIAYFEKLARDMYEILDRRLDGRLFMVGNSYTLADLGFYPDVRQTSADISIRDYPRLNAWYERISARAAVQRAYSAPNRG